MTELHKKSLTEILKALLDNHARLMAFTQPVILQAAAFAASQPNNALDPQDILATYMSTFVTNAPVMAGLLDHNYRFVALSGKCVDWLKKFHNKQIREEDVLGKSFFEMFNDCPTSLQRGLKSSKKGKNRYYESVEWKLSPRRTRWVRWESFPWLGYDQELQGVIFFCEDVTSQQESVLLARNLERANELLQSFSLVFSHDLLQPIRQVSNFITLLKNYLSSHKLGDEFIDHAFDLMQQSLRQIYDLSEGMALYCKEGTLAVNPQPTSFQDTLTQIQENCFTTKSIELNNLVEQDVTLHMNPTCLWQLLQNLITNAVKYTPAEKPVVTINGKKLENGYFECTVHNPGYCPSRKVRKHIFDPFQSTHIQGAGLGMTICKQIVTAYKGKISFQSSPKRGTKVTFTLPEYLESSAQN